jgi:hypothetical protein
MKFRSIFYIFGPIWIKFNARDVHTSVLSDCEFRGRRHCDKLALLTEVS